MSKWSMIGLAAAVAAAAHPASAANCAKVSFSPSTISQPSWDPINPAAVTASFSATIRPDSSSTRSVRIIFLDNNDRTAPVRLGTVTGGSGPIYEVLDSSGRNIAFPQNSSIAAATNPTVGSQNDAMTVPLRVNLPARTDAQDYYSGTYSETINYAVQCFAASGKSNGIDGPIAGPVLTVTIPQLVSITTGSAATIDFQNFTTTISQLSVGVRSTSRVLVSVRTDNGGRMVRTGAPSSSPPLNSYIPYKMSLSGQPLTTSTMLSRAGTSGTNWPLVLNIESLPQGKIAGTYLDTITLTMTPMN